jgi:hypothetical protein
VSPSSKNSIVVVSGLPRSGTSLMMQILGKAGLALLTDQLRAADLDNERGYYEYEPVKLMKDGDLAWMRSARGKAVKIISYLLVHLPPSYHYKVVFMLRNLPEVVASQNRMLEDKGEKEAASAGNEDLVRIFSTHLQATRRWLAAQPNMQTVFVDYNRLIQDPGKTLETVESFLGLSLDKPEILSIVDPKSYRQRAGS